MTDELDISAVRYVVMGGEETLEADFELFKQHFSRPAKFVNGLGPSESTLALQFHADHDTRLRGGIVPVGSPVAGTDVVLLDEAGCSTGFCGEFGIRSHYVTPGYWNAPELTAKVFVTASDEIPVYRAGDMGRILPDGNFLFTGRRDQQVKIRGYRVEPGEVESILAECSDIERCVVVARNNAAGEMQLVAYAVWNTTAENHEHIARELLKSRLPNYMIPSVFVQLDEMPLTASGKVARRELPELETIRHVAVEGELPESEGQKTLAIIWKRLLKVDQVALEDDFFDIGGHSLLTIKLLQEIERLTGEQLSIADVFESPTIREFSILLEHMEWHELEDEGTSIASSLLRFIGRLSGLAK
jgi:acyl-coenzyme A synthetase/AMP-(fatty) acid ligase